MPDTELQKARFETLSGTPEYFAVFLRRENTRWARVAKEADILPMN